MSVTMPPRPVLARILRIAVLAALSLPGCGKGGTSPEEAVLRIEIAGSSTDKPWPSDGFALRAADGRLIPLVHAAGAAGDGPVLEAKGAPGRYRVVAPPDWRAYGAADALDIRADVPPVKVGVGRPHTLYAWPPGGRAVSMIRCTRQATFETPAVDVGAESVIGDDGAAALRVPAEQWRGSLEVRAIVGPSKFMTVASALIDRIAAGDAPVGVNLEPMAAVPVPVVVVRPPGEDTGTPTELMASVAVSVLKVAVPVPLDAKGRGVLAEIPREVSELSLYARGAQAWDAIEAARVHREIRLFVSTAPSAELGTLEIRVVGAAGDARPVLEVRPEGGASFAMPSFTGVRQGADGHRLRTALPAGRYHVLVTCGGRGAIAAAPVDVARGGDVVIELPLSPLASLRCSLVGGIATVSEWHLVARRVEGAVEIDGQSFVVRGLARPDADLDLPIGRYRVRAVVNGAEAPAVDIDLSAPGTRASIDLRPVR